MKEMGLDQEKLEYLLWDRVLLPPLSELRRPAAVPPLEAPDAYEVAPAK